MLLERLLTLPCGTDIQKDSGYCQQPVAVWENMEVLRVTAPLLLNTKTAMQAPVCCVSGLFVFQAMLALFLLQLAARQFFLGW